MEQTNIIDLGKVGITVEKTPWNSSTFYERLTMVHHKESGNTYVSVENNINRDPSNDDGSNWILASSNGMSIYELMVARGKYSGTEEQFLADYAKAVADANAGAAAANLASTAALAAADEANEAKAQTAAATELCENATAACNTATSNAQTAANNANAVKIALDNFIEQGGGATDAQVIKNTGDIATLGSKQSELEKEVIYDVTANNDGATFASLSELLSSENLSTLIPSTVRYGGMSIRFVLTSDNKYVQYRLTADNWSTDTNDWAIADEGVYVNNPEFVYVKTDAENKILWAIKADGSIYYGAGVPQQIIDYVEEKIADLSLDEYENIVTFLNDLEKGDENLQDLLDKKVDGEYIENNEWAIVIPDNNNKVIEGTRKDGSKYIGGSIEIIGNLSTKDIDANGFSTEVVEDAEFFAAEISQNGKLLSGTRKDGSHYIRELDSESLDRKVDKKEGKDLVDSEITNRISFKESIEYIEVNIDNENKVLEGTTVEGKKVVNIPVEVNNKFGVKGNSVDGITDIEERVEVITDADNKVIAYRKIDGTLVENVGIETPNGKIDTLVVNDLQLSDKSKAELLGDASNPYLRLDRIDIISDLLTVSGNNISPLTVAGNEVGDTDTDDVVFKYSSKDGGFVDNCVIAYQGNSSMRWVKKGFAVDLQNKHRFKDWIEHDSFNIKAYATDWMHVREYIGTTIYEQMMQHRPIGHNRPWEVYNDFKDSDYQNGCPSSALGHSDQHPVELYINGTYWGLYSISLKKKKENYEMKKNNAKHIMLDADGFSCAGSSFSWGGAEIRFPKEDKNKHKLLDKDLNTYDGEHPTELLGADNPLYDEDNPTHVFCNTVKQRILAFYQFMHDIDSNTTKAQIEEHWNVEEFIDNYLQTNFICNGDVGGKNTLYCTWDGVHFAPLAYDFDLTFGCSWTNGITQADVHLAFEKYPATGNDGSWDVIPGISYVKSLYQTEIEARYKDLRDCGIFSAENVAKIIKDWMFEVGEDVYKDDLDRWDGVYGNRGTKNMYGEDDVECYVNQIALYNYIVTRLVSLDTLFNYTAN